MKQKIAISLLLVCCLLTTACTPLERQAYNTLVASKAFLNNEQSLHPECTTTSTSSFCTIMFQAIGSQHLLADALNVYCGQNVTDVPNTPCNPPAKGTPASDQAVAHLKSALSNFNQIESDFKKVVK